MSHNIPYYFEFSISNPIFTELVVVSLLDKRTGFMVRTALPNHGKETASIMAFAGARYSRSSDSAEQLLREIKKSGKDANERLSTIFRKYGHASVADMAQLFAYIENVPMNYGMKFFYETSVGGGQERSTRYQDYSATELYDLSYYRDYFKGKDIKQDEFDRINKEFLAYQTLSVKYYNKYKAKLTKKYTEIYEVDSKKASQTGALTARVFDSARYFLLNGVSNKTSLAWITSAREWARIISIFKSSKDMYMQYLAEQLEFLFAPSAEAAEEIGYVPEAPDLIRYTGADETTSNNLVQLSKILEKDKNFQKLLKEKSEFGFRPLKVKVVKSTISAGMKVLMQNILSIYPSLDYKKILEWIKSLDDSAIDKMIEALYQGFNHHKQMGNQFRTNEYSFVADMSISEAKDLNRHRAWGRFIPMFASENNMMSILNDGYTLPLYLTDNPNLKVIREEFENDLNDLYIKLKEFTLSIEKTSWFPQSLYIQLLPYAHICRMFMHASPKELSYMTKLRVRPGGHINYRMIAYELANKGAEADKFIAPVAFTKEERPDPSSREEFLDRS